MPLPAPRRNLVIRYAYLWHDDHRRGQEEGDKDRPCVIALTTEDAAGETIVTVLPITHTPPGDASTAIEIPQATKQRLGLDAERSWIICNELNRFVWPGPDLRFIPSRPGEIVYGDLPYGLFDRIKALMLKLHTAHRIRAVSRS